MTDTDLSNFFVDESASIADALRAIDKGAASIAMVTTPERLLLAVVTDGDIRRALLAGRSLTDPVIDIANRSPLTVPTDLARTHVLDQMRHLRIVSVPSVDEKGRVTGLHTMSDLVGRTRLPHVAVIMAGGRGTRLRELTTHMPKPLMPVAGRPIIEWIILNLVESGIERVIVSLGHLGDQIETRVGSGRHLGATVTYVREDADSPLDTAGGLALIDRGYLPDDQPILVSNGDLMVRYDAAELLAAHQAQQSVVTVASRVYTHEVPFGVLETGDDGGVCAVREKPLMEMLISSGVYVLSLAALDHLLAGEPCSMPELLHRCLDAGQRVGTWSLPGEWQDIGTQPDLRRARGHQ